MKTHSLSSHRLQALQFKTLSNPSHLLFRKWAALYHRRFPYQELAPLTGISESLEKGESKLHGVVDSKTHSWAGFTLMEIYGASTLLAYLATAPAYEGKGLARKMVHQVLEKHLTPSQPYLWLEANPKLWAFYRKLGFKRLVIDYRIPEFYSDGSEKMGLFIKTFDSDTQIEKQVVESFVSELFLSGYGIESSDLRYQRQMQVIRDYPASIVTTL